MYISAWKIKDQRSQTYLQLLERYKVGCSFEYFQSFVESIDVRDSWERQTTKEISTSCADIPIAASELLLMTRTKKGDGTDGMKRNFRSLRNLQYVFC